MWCLLTLSHLRDQGPFSLMIFPLQLRFDESLFCYQLNYKQTITTKLCTCHDSCAWRASTLVLMSDVLIAWDVALKVDKSAAFNASTEGNATIMTAFQFKFFICLFYTSIHNIQKQKQDPRTCQKLQLFTDNDNNSGWQTLHFSGRAQVHY